MLQAFMTTHSPIAPGLPIARITPCVVILARTYGTHINAVAVETTVKE